MIKLFHGANKTYLDSILEKGILGNTAEGYEVRGSVFTSPRADIAFAYAGMLGGELNCRGHLTDEDRVLLILEIPDEWYNVHHVRDVAGSCPETSFDCNIPAEFIVDYVIGDRKEVYKHL